MPFLSVEGVTLAYRDVGQGPPLLLLHAFPLTADAFAPQWEALSSRYRIIAPDLRGFGQSQTGGGPNEMTRFALDALALLDHLGLRSTVVGGVSMGGYIALALAQLDPGRVRGLVLLDTQAGADDETGRARREETARAVETQGIGVLVQSQPPRLLGPAATEATRKHVEGLIAGNAPQGAAAALRGMALRPDSRGILARFAGPTLVVVGEDDAVTPLLKAQEMVALVPGATLVRIPNAGHLAHLENPASVNAALRAFLDPLTPDGPG